VSLYVALNCELCDPFHHQASVFIWQSRYNSNTLNMGQLMHMVHQLMVESGRGGGHVHRHGGHLVCFAYRDWKPWASSSFLVSCSLSSSTCTCSSPICSWRSDDSPSSFRLAFSSSCRPFSSFFSRSGGGGERGEERVNDQRQYRDRSLRSR